MNPRLHRAVIAGVALSCGGCGGSTLPAPTIDGPSAGLDSASSGDTLSASSQTGTSESPIRDTDSPLPSICGRGTIEDVIGGRLRRCEVLFAGSISRAHGVDLDDDGRDEVFIDGSNAFDGLRLFWWTDSEIIEQEVVGNGGAYADQCMVRHDFDDDGIRDLSCIKSGLTEPGVWKNLEVGLGDFIEQPPLADVWAWSAGLPIDADVDGRPERLAAVIDPAPQGLQLFREVDGVMVQTGARHPLGGCGRPNNIAYADFDEDGIDDAVAVDHPTLCDGYPPEYDPTWHLTHILLSRSDHMELSASIPTGAVPTHLWGRAFAGDMTGDGHADLALNLEPPGLVSYIRGYGDGTFGAAMVFMAEDIGLPRPNSGGQGTEVRYFGQFDDDPAPEVVASFYPDRTWVLDDPAAGMGILETYEIEATPRGIGDFDGDGIGDLVMSSSSGNQKEAFLLLSSD